MHGSVPQVGRQADVVLDGIPLRLVPGTWSCGDAPRFGQKISTGTLTYADFNEYESAHSVSTLAGGYGLRKYTDLDRPDDGASMYDEGDDVDASQGVVTLAPRVIAETLPDAAAPVVWIGELTPEAGPLRDTALLVAVGGAKVWYRHPTTGAWTDTGVALPADARQGAVGVFGGRLIVGFGASAKAVWSNDLTSTYPVRDEASTDLYVWATANDRSASYVAGGPADTDSNKVTSSAVGGYEYESDLVTCGGRESEITALAPGGGVVTVFVGKTSELACIDLNGVYRSLVPFDSRLSTNCVGLNWWMARGGDAQRGSVILVFPRDRSPWAYKPSSQDAGEAQNLGAWAQPGLRPRTVRGRPTAFQGTARWLYYAVAGPDGSHWIVRRDGRTGATHTWLSRDASECRAMAVTSLHGTNPRLYFGSGNDVAYVDLPLDGESPRDDDVATYAIEGRIDLPAVEMGFPDEDKVLFYLRVITANLAAGQREIAAYYALDDAESWTSLGRVHTSPAQELRFPAETSCKSIRLRFVLTTDHPNETPELWGFSLRLSLNPRTYKLWGFQAYLPGFAHTTGDEDLRDPYRTLNDLWDALRDGTTLSFTDRWKDVYDVRLLRMREQEVISEPDRTPETVVEFSLLEMGRGDGDLIYDDPESIYDDFTALYA